jgi:hypothetical protein
MLLLGLLLVGAAAAFAGLVIADNYSGGPSYAVTVLGNHIATLNTLEAFLAGAALALVFCLGLALLFGGTRHAARRRGHLRSARRAARDAAAERDLMAASRTRDGEPTAGTERDRGTGRRHRHGRHLFGH